MTTLIDTIHERVAARAAAAQLMITAAGVADIDRYLSEERSRDRDADRRRCRVKSVPVHVEGITDVVR